MQTRIVFEPLKRNTIAKSLSGFVVVICTVFYILWLAGALPSYKASIFQEVFSVYSEPAETYKDGQEVQMGDGLNDGFDKMKLVLKDRQISLQSKVNSSKSASSQDSVSQQTAQSSVVVKSSNSGSPQSSSVAVMPAPRPVSSQQPSVAPKPPQSPPAAAMSAQTARILLLTNQLRQSSGLAPLSINPQLTSAAMFKTCDIINKSYFAHNTPDGMTIVQQARRFGYASDNVTENLAYGPSADPDVVFGLWLKSSGHKANMLRPDLKEIGIGWCAGTFRGAVNTTVVGQMLGSR